MPPKRCTQSVPLVDGPVRFDGAASVQPCGDFWRPWRLDLGLKDLYHPQLLHAAAVASGVRLAFASDADAVELDYTHASIFHGCAFDLVVDGRVITKRVPAVAPLPPGLTGDEKRSVMESHPRAARPPRATVAWSGLGASGLTRRFELWLPHATVVRYHALRVDAEDGGDERWKKEKRQLYSTDGEPLPLFGGPYGIAYDEHGLPVEDIDIEEDEDGLGTKGSDGRRRGARQPGA